MGFRQVFHDVLGGPAAAGHDRGAGFDAIELAVFEVGDADERRPLLGSPSCWTAITVERETNSGGGLRSVERGEVDLVARDSLDACSGHLSRPGSRLFTSNRAMVVLPPGNI